MKKPKDIINDVIRYKDIDFHSEKAHILDEDILDNDIEDSHKKHYFSSEVYIRLKMAADYIKEYYSKIRNEANKFSKLVFKSINTGDVFLFKNKILLKIVIYSNHIKVYFNLNCKDFGEIKTNDCSTIYKHLNSFVSVNDDKSYNLLLNLFMIFAKKNRIDIVEEDYINYARDGLCNSQEIIKLLGLTDLLVKTATTSNCNTLSLNSSKNATIMQKNPFKRKGKKNIYEITVGELSQAFKGKYEITLFLLQEVGLASGDHNYLKVIASGDCKYKMTVYADEYDVESVKMIILTGGNVVKYI